MRELRIKEPRPTTRMRVVFDRHLWIVDQAVRFQPAPPVRALLHPASRIVDHGFGLLLGECRNLNLKLGKLILIFKKLLVCLEFVVVSLPNSHNRGAGAWS
jgi:hypothetical protein